MLVCLGLVDLHRSEPRNPAHLRIDDRLHERRRDGCIHHVAAIAQHIEPCIDRFGLWGAYHCVSHWLDPFYSRTEHSRPQPESVILPNLPRRHLLVGHCPSYPQPMPPDARRLGGEEDTAVAHCRRKCLERTS